MRSRARRMLVAAGIAAIASASRPAAAGTRTAIDRAVMSGLSDLYASSPEARALRAKAKGVLVFPNVVKGGFLFAGLYGEGALVRHGKPVAYYTTLAASYGFQAGLQQYGYAMFLMTDSALGYLDKSGGWEIGTGPSLTIVDQGFATSLSTSTLRSDVYAIFFNQKGLMGGIGVQGTKITRIYPEP